MRHALRTDGVDRGGPPLTGVPSPQLIVNVNGPPVASAPGVKLAGVGSVNWPMSAIDSSEPSLIVWLGAAVSVGPT